MNHNRNVCRIFIYLTFAYYLQIADHLRIMLNANNRIEAFRVATCVFPNFVNNPRCSSIADKIFHRPSDSNSNRFLISDIPFIVTHTHLHMVKVFTVTAFNIYSLCDTQHTSISHPFVRPPIKMRIETRQRNSFFPLISCYLHDESITVRSSIRSVRCSPKKRTKRAITMNIYWPTAACNIMKKGNKSYQQQQQKSHSIYDVQIGKNEKKRTHREGTLKNIGVENGFKL